MRLAIEHETQHDDAARRELLELDWCGLGKLVQIEALSLIGADFEELAQAGCCGTEDLGDAA